MGAGELAVIMVLGIPFVAVVGGIFLAALRILRGGSGGDHKMRADEARMIQDIYHGLLKMEDRIESLETLLLDRDKKGGSQ